VALFLESILETSIAIGMQLKTFNEGEEFQYKVARISTIAVTAL
jgi:hypothetical protein